MSNSPFLTAVCFALAIVVVSLALAPPIHHPNPPRETRGQQTEENQDKSTAFKPVPPPADIQCDPNCATQETDNEGYPSYAAWLLHKAINDPITGFSGLLVVATFILAVISGFQIRDARIVQRAFISVEPGGIRPFKGDDDRIACDIIIRNAGNLPARKVAWFIDKKYSENPAEKDFPIAAITNQMLGDIVLAPKGKIRKGSIPSDKQTFDTYRNNAQPDRAWLFVWGRVSYHDGFRAGRHTDFCHRYNLRGARGFAIKRKNGRYHEYGNRTDEG
jgi:hypothetical protein